MYLGGAADMLVYWAQYAQMQHEQILQRYYSLWNRRNCVEMNWQSIKLSHQTAPTRTFFWSVVTVYKCKVNLWPLVMPAAANSALTVVAGSHQPYWKREKLEHHKRKNSHYNPKHEPWLIRFLSDSCPMCMAGIDNLQHVLFTHVQTCHCQSWPWWLKRHYLSNLIRSP